MKDGYIDRIMAVKAAQYGADNWAGYVDQYRDDYIEDAIYNIPIADVEEVRHAKWMKKYQSGRTILKGFVSSCCDMWNERDSNYCPYCGAKMDDE